MTILGALLFFGIFAVLVISWCAASAKGDRDQAERRLRERDPLVEFSDEVGPWTFTIPDQRERDR